MWRRSRDRSKEASDFGSGLIGAMAAAPEADAADAMREGMDRFRCVARSTKPPHLLKGNLFEYIEAAKFNADAARKGIDSKAYVTASEGRPSGPVDIEIRNNRGNVVKRAQLKGHNDGQKAVRELARKKYSGMHKQTLKGNSGEARGIKEELDWGGASSGGTTPKELKRATDNPGFYAGLQETKTVFRESAVAGANAAAAGAVIGGAQSAVRNLYAYSKGHKDSKQVAADIAKDSAKSGTRSGLAGWFGSVLRHVGKRVGSNALAKSNVATAVASGVIDAGVVVYEFARGEVTAEEAAERLGDTGCSTLSGIYLGAAAGAVFGPAGAIVGSVVGYMLAASVYQSSVAILKEAKLAEEEADRIVALCEAAARAMDEQRGQFEAKLATSLNVRQVSFDRHFKQIDDALFADDHRKAIKGLSGLAKSFSKELRLGEFKDFREFMVESDEPLRL